MNNVKSAEATTGHSENQEVASHHMEGMSSKSCHGDNSSDAITVADKGSCLHCSISMPATAQKIRPLSFASTVFPGDEFADVHASIVADTNQVATESPPPRHKSPIYIVNSIFII